MKLALELNAIETTALATILLVLGMLLKQRIKFLKNFCIPVPVIGGFIFAILMWIGHETNTGSVSLNTSLQTPSMILFFTTVGIGGSFRLFKIGGKALIIYLVACWTVAIMQTFIGAGVAKVVGLDSIMGLMAGAVSLEGGHGAAATFGSAVEEMGVQGASTVALACATFGLFIGGILGGPVAKLLIDRNNLKIESTEVHQDFDEKESSEISAENLIKMLALILLLMWVGEYVAKGVILIIKQVAMIFGKSVNPFFPAYVGSMIAALIFRNINDIFGFVKIRTKEINLLSSVSLSVFLAMAMMKLKVWDLYDLALPILLILITQIVFLVLFTVFIVFKMLGKDYDAAVMSAGMLGHGLGATPNGVANMTSVCEKYKTFSYKAFLIVPLSGAVLIDIVAIPIITWSINYFA